MLRAVLLAYVPLAAFATVSTGKPTCKCLGALPDTIVRKKCTYDHAYAGECVTPSGLTSNFTSYPADFGATCKIHKDPGMQACYDLTKYPPVEKPKSDQATWCFQAWCYVDPCNCDLGDPTKSDFFPGVLHYSYETCGTKNSYTAEESSTNTVGNAECSQVEEKGSDAHSLKMGLGLLLAGMGVMM